MNFKAKDVDNGFTVLELYDALHSLIVKGYPTLYVYGRDGEPMRYAELVDLLDGGKRVEIKEAY